MEGLLSTGPNPSNFLLIKIFARSSSMTSRKHTKSIPSFHIRRQLKIKVDNLEPCNCVFSLFQKEDVLSIDAWCTMSWCLSWRFTRLFPHLPQGREFPPQLILILLYSSKQRKDTNTCPSCCTHSGFSLVHYLSKWGQFSWLRHSLSDRGEIGHK